MNKKSISILVAITVGLLGLVFLSQNAFVDAPEVVLLPIATYQNAAKEMIKVDGIQPGNFVQSPLAVTGTALGNWYFEGSFPLEVRDSNDTLIGNSIGIAQGDWMTERSVQFYAEITFTSTTATGTLVLKNDNPSGDPIRDRALIIPVTFQK